MTGCLDHSRRCTLSHVTTAVVSTALLGLMLGTPACSPKTRTIDQDFYVDFKNHDDERYVLEIGGTQMHEVKPGTPRVHVRVSGGTATEITVTLWDATGKVCAMTTVSVSGGDEVVIDLSCEPPPDAAAPGETPDAGADAGQVADGADADKDATPDSRSSPECQRYCGVMRERCPLVYRTDAECLATCAALGWEPGELGTRSGNTIECRITSALAATVPDQLEFCYPAGPSGGDCCGALCANFCQAASQCPDLLTGGTVASCIVDRCTTRPVPTMALRSEAGDTLECRIFWLGQSTTDPSQTCARLAPGAQDSPCRQ